MKQRPQRVSSLLEEEVPLDRANLKFREDEQDSFENQRVSFEYSNEILNNGSTVPMSANKVNWVNKYDNDLVFRADDTINFQRNPNLSIGNRFEISGDKKEKEEIANDMISEKLISYFRTYIEPYVCGKKYAWNRSNCKLPFLSSKLLEEGQETPEMSFNKANHSFRYSWNLSGHKINGFNYIKDLFQRNIKIRDIVDFNEAKYYGDGIINTYLGIISVYFEYELAISEGQNQRLIKILDTRVIEEIDSCCNSPELIDETIIQEIEDFFDYDVVLIPVFLKKDKRCLLVVVDNQEDIIKVTLYDRKRIPHISDEDVVFQLEDISDFVHIILEKSLSFHDMILDENKIEGDTVILEVSEEKDMIPTILQIWEGIVLSESQLAEESIEEMRHKIVDRLVAFYQLI